MKAEIISTIFLTGLGIGVGVQAVGVLMLCLGLSGKISGGELVFFIVLLSISVLCFVGVYFVFPFNISLNAA